MADSRSSAVREVLAFLLHHWWQEKKKVAVVVLTICAATGADLLLPLYSGRLIDALALPLAQRHHALFVALKDVLWMAILGAVLVIARYLSFYAISPEPPAKKPAIGAQSPVQTTAAVAGSKA